METRADRTEAVGLVAVVLGTLLIVLLNSCAGDPAPDRAEPAVASLAGAVPAQVPAAPPTPPPYQVSGAVTAGRDVVVPAAAATRIGPGGKLTAYAGREAAGNSVPVVSVPADEGFWVGYGPDDRVWVELTGGPPESPYDVDRGDLVSFTGRMVANAKGFAKRSGVVDAEGRRQLEAQQAHVAVDKGALNLNK